MAKKLKLLAVEAADLDIIAAACQDALFLAKEAQYLPKARRFAIAINRFVWEKGEKSALRIPALLSFDGVLSVRAKGVNPNSNIPLSVLNIEFIADKEPPSGELILKLAEGYEIALSVECLDITLADIGEAKAAKQRPNHEGDDA